MKTIKSLDLNMKVELDENEIFPNDPGQGTPVIVTVTFNHENFCSTWNCATSEGECDGHRLTPEQLAWLDEVTPEVEAWMEARGV